jgi:hypothetical protein
MRSRNLQKLQSFIQEWIDEYYGIRKNKVKQKKNGLVQYKNLD